MTDIEDISGIIFDLDGTLVDSRDHILNYYRDLFKFLDRPFPDSNTQLFYTLDQHALEAQFFSTAELENVEVFRERDPYIDRLTEISAIEGAEELLDSIYGNNIPLGIVTNRGSSTIPLLKQLNWHGYFETVISANIIARPKPHPEGLLKVAQAWEKSVENLLFIGDAAIDAECARQAGTHFWHIAVVHDSLENHRSFGSLNGLQDCLSVVLRR